MKFIMLYGLLILIVLFLSACQDNYETSCPACNCDTTEKTCPEINVACPFSMSFTKTYVREDYITATVISHKVESSSCDEALYEQKAPTGDSLCYIKEAVIVTDAGYDTKNAQLWKWNVLCACSYEQ